VNKAHVFSLEKYKKHSMQNHYHCDICGKSYDKRTQADACFWNHGETAVLRWLALEMYCTKYFAERNGDVPEDPPPYWFKIDRINELYQFAEEDNGVIWNKILPDYKI